MATMQQVAERAGVSIATVSFVVNGSKKVLPHTRERVEAAMRELGYSRNHAGSALARGRTDIIALLYPAFERNLSGTAMTFFTSAADRARERGYTLVLWPAHNEAAEITELTASGLVDGVLLMEVQLEDGRVDRLKEGRTPFALIGRTQDPEGMAWVDVDFASSVETAIEELVALGHTSILYISGATEKRFVAHGGVARARESYLQTMAQSGLTATTLTCGENSAAGRLLAAELVEHHPDATAIILMNEHAAPGLAIGLAQHGVRVPDDLSIISIGTSAHMASMAEPVLTHMDSPAAELGRLGVDAIIERINEPDRPLPQTLIPCTPGEGASVARAPGR
ncbi:LacI family DNA-binding transcriptional regulator [Microbacterium sp. KNMS]